MRQFASTPPNMTQTPFQFPDAPFSMLSISLLARMMLVNPHPVFGVGPNPASMRCVGAMGPFHWKANHATIDWCPLNTEASQKAIKPWIVQTAGDRPHFDGVNVDVAGVIDSNQGADCVPTVKNRPCEVGRRVQLLLTP